MLVRIMRASESVTRRADELRSKNAFSHKRNHSLQVVRRPYFNFPLISPFTIHSPRSPFLSFPSFPSFLRPFPFRSVPLREAAPLNPGKGFGLWAGERRL